LKRIDDLDAFDDLTGLQVFGKNLVRPSIDRGGDYQGIPEEQPVSTKILALIQFITGRRAAAAVEAFLQLGQGFIFGPQVGLFFLNGFVQLVAHHPVKEVPCMAASIFPFRSTSLSRLMVMFCFMFQPLEGTARH
jgi:hypothetical protein